MIPIFFFLFYFRFYYAKNIHLVLNSHLDITWGSSYTDLYEGPLKCGKCVFDKIIQFLSEEPLRTFTFSELYYVFQYFDEINDEKKKFF